jgi:1-deoxy-D-xylulose-5-phosphate synthase
MIPGMVIMAPKDEAELRDMLYTATEYKNGPVALRYPRGSALGVELKEGFRTLEIGKAEKLIDGDDVALLALGSMVDYSLKAAAKLKEQGISCEVVNMRFAKPVDTNMLDIVANKFNKLVTLEENNLPGGFGSAVAEYFISKNYKNDLQFIGLPDKFVDHGTQEELHHILGIDPDGIVERVKEFTKLNKINHEVSL